MTWDNLPNKMIHKYVQSFCNDWLHVLKHKAEILNIQLIKQLHSQNSSINISSHLFWNVTQWY